VLEGDDCEESEERNPGAGINCKISNQAAARWYVEAGTKDRELEATINGLGGGQKDAPASPRLLAWTLIILESPNKQTWRGCNKWSSRWLVPKNGLFLII
jgi:hypothetical protein